MTESYAAVGGGDHSDHCTIAAVRQKLSRSQWRLHFWFVLWTQKHQLKSCTLNQILCDDPVRQTLDRKSKLENLEDKPIEVISCGKLAESDDGSQR